MRPIQDSTAPARAQDMADCARTAQLDEAVICAEPSLIEADRRLREASWRLIGVLADQQLTRLRDRRRTR